MSRKYEGVRVEKAGVPREGHYLEEYPEHLDQGGTLLSLSPTLTCLHNGTSNLQN